MQHIIDRFTRYVMIDTQSDPHSKTTPSTKKQWDLAHLLYEELKSIGMKEVTMDGRKGILWPPSPQLLKRKPLP